MIAYKGRAVVIAEGKNEVAVTANLRQHRNGLRTHWGGTLTPTPDGLQQVRNLTGGTLRLPDGREAQFLRPDTTDWVASNQLTIVGQLDAPFLQLVRQASANSGRQRESTSSQTAGQSVYVQVWLPQLKVRVVPKPTTPLDEGFAFDA